MSESNQVYCCDQNNTNCSWQNSCRSNQSQNYTSVIVAGVLICVMIAVIIICKIFVCSSKRLNDVKEEMILLRKVKELRGELPLERHGVFVGLQQIVLGVPVAPKIPMIHATISKEAKDQFRSRLQKNVIITRQDSENYYEETEDDMAYFDEEIRKRGLQRASSSSSQISVPDSWSNFDAFSPNNIKIHDFSQSTLSSKESTYDSSIISSGNLASVYGVKAPTRTPSKFKKLAGNSLSKDEDNLRVRSFIKQTSTFSDNSMAHSDRSHHDRHLLV